MKRIDWVLYVQVCAIILAAHSAPDPWQPTVFWSLLLIAATCGPEHPWGRRANGLEQKSCLSSTRFPNPHKE